MSPLYLITSILVVRFSREFSRGPVSGNGADPERVVSARSPAGNGQARPGLFPALLAAEGRGGLLLLADRRAGRRRHAREAAGQDCRHREGDKCRAGQEGWSEGEVLLTALFTDANLSFSSCRMLANTEFQTE